MGYSRQSLAAWDAYVCWGCVEFTSGRDETLSPNSFGPPTSGPVGSGQVIYTAGRVLRRSPNFIALAYGTVTCPRVQYAPLRGRKSPTNSCQILVFGVVSFRTAGYRALLNGVLWVGSFGSRQIIAERYGYVRSASLHHRMGGRVKPSHKTMNIIYGPIVGCVIRPDDSERMKQ